MWRDQTGCWKCHVDLYLTLIIVCFPIKLRTRKIWQMTCNRCLGRSQKTRLGWKNSLHICRDDLKVQVIPGIRATTSQPIAMRDDFIFFNNCDANMDLPLVKDNTNVAWHYMKLVSVSITLPIMLKVTFIGDRLLCYSSECNSPKGQVSPDNKVHGANMGPTWVVSAPDGPHVGPVKLVMQGPQQLLSAMTCPITLALYFR